MAFHISRDWNGLRQVVRSWTTSLLSHLETRRRSFAKTPKFFKNICFAALALIAGSLAQQSAQETAVKRWLTENAPSFSTWQAILQSHRFHPVTDSNQERKLWRTFPNHGLTPSSAWIRSDLKVIAVQDAKAENVHFFISDSLAQSSLSPSSQEEWQWSGNGLEGLNQVLMILAEAAKQNPKPIKKQQESDPREIHY